MVEYEVIDFKGFVQWVMLDDGSYAVDPLYVQLFLDVIG